MRQEKDRGYLFSQGGIMITVLWLCNLATRAISESIGVPPSTGGGWLETLSDMLSTQREINLHYCFFSKDIFDRKDGNVNKIAYHGFPISRHLPISAIEHELVKLIQEITPDIVHIFGSEYTTSYAMLKACQKTCIVERTILHIQGLVSVLADYYDTGIPRFWKYAMMPRDFIKYGTIAYLKKQFRLRGKYEKETIKALAHVCGRTDWDKACSLRINPHIRYHHCNETLRQSFYNRRWKIEMCEKHSIFVSQGHYPIKGLHFLLEALPQILEQYPDTHVYIAGPNPTRLDGSIFAKLKRTSYGQYLVNLIKKNKLKKTITFTGPLNEEQMCDRLVRSHVFVSPSTIENSPNSLAEAMILGMPIVSSYVGGVPSMLDDKIEGYLYQADAPYMLAYYINRLFSNDDNAIKMGTMARQRANTTHNVENVLHSLLSIYMQLRVDDYNVCS